MLPSLRLLLFVCSAPLWAAVPRAPLTATGAGALAQLPLRFEANRGQFGPHVRYAARAGNFDLLLTDRGASLAPAGGPAVALHLLRSNPAARPEPLDKLATRTDYFVGRRAAWRTAVPSYARVRYREVYPGIDVIYYGRAGRLEYDFVLAPGADPRAIRLQFRGASRLAITPDGDAAFDSPAGRIAQQRPAIFQDGRQVHGRYVLLGRNTLGLRLDPYDRRRPLTIDPVLVYSTYIGGPATDQVIGVKLDAKGRLYIVGSTDHSTDPAYPDPDAAGNAYKAASAGMTDIFIAVIDTTPAGGYQLLYYSYLGGSNVDTPRAMQVDAAGRVYIAGVTASSDFPTAGSAVMTTGAGSANFAFVSAVDPGLDQPTDTPLFYSTFLGSNTAASSANGIDVDNQGNIYVIGATRASDFPVTASAYQGSLWGPHDAFIAKLSLSSSTMVYGTFLGGESDDDGRAIAVTSTGQVYFAINTVSQQFPQAGNQYSPTLRGGENIALGLMDMTRSGVDSLLYTTYFGGSGVDEARKIALDAKGNLLVTGLTQSPDLPVTGDAVQIHYGGNTDAFVAVVNPANPAFIAYLTYLGGSHGEVGYDIAGDPAGNIYVTGYTMSPDFPVTANAPQTSWGNGIDVFLTKLKPGTPGPAALQYSTYLGQASINVAYGLAVATDGTVFLGGYTGGQWATTPNSTRPAFAGGYTDGFVTAIK